MNKNVKKRIVSALLLGSLFVSAVTVTKAATYHNYDFFMTGQGGADRSSDARKVESGDAPVKIESISTSAAPGRPLTMRIRKSSNDSRATGPMTVYKTDRCTIYMSYLSGYGGTGTNYYLKMQTNSLAAQCAWADGRWHP